MAAGRFNVSSSRKNDVQYPRKQSGGEKHVEFGKLLRDDGGVERYEKKRKISSNGWSRDDKEVRISTRNRVVSTNSSVLLLQNLSGDLETAKNGSVGSEGSGTRRCETTLLSLKTTSCDGEVAEVEGEELGKTWKGLTCRWSDEVESDDESTYKKVDHEAATLATSDVEMSSPESGEIVGRSSGGHGRGSSSYSMGNDTMEIDDNRDELTSDRHLDSDSEDDDDFKEQHQEVSNHRHISMLHGCRNAFEYEKIQKISEGSYGIVYKAKDKVTGEIVALKKVKMGRNTEGFPITSLREINLLMSLHHPTIVDVKEVVMDDHDGVYVVMEYMEHDLKQLMNVMKQPFSQSDVKCLMLQLLEGVKFLHDNWVLHRDLKTSNLLFNNQGELKICDFGMARQYGDPLKPYTPLVVTLWYRAPEILLGAKQYSTAIDMWSVGCIMAEMLAKEALFMGENEIQQLDKIFRVLGTPNEAIWPGFSSLPGSKAKFVKQPYNLLRKKFPAATFTGSPVLTELGFDLLSKLLTYDPEERITAEEALNHGWFREVPLPKSKEFMPTFPCSFRKN